MKPCRFTPRTPLYKNLLPRTEVELCFIVCVTVSVWYFFQLSYIWLKILVKVVYKEVEVTSTWNFEFTLSFGHELLKLYANLSSGWLIIELLSCYSNISQVQSFWLRYFMTWSCGHINLKLSTLLFIMMWTI